MNPIAVHPLQEKEKEIEKEIEKMSRISLDIPERSLLALKLSTEQVGNELRLAAAIKLYEIGRLSSGAAAELAGIPKPLFLMKLGDYGVDTFRLTQEELENEAPLNEARLG